jgi:hypothetical protein
MQTLAVVKDLDVLKEDRPGLLIGCKDVAVGTLRLEGAPHRFHTYIVSTMTFPTHTESNAVFQQHVPAHAARCQRP